MSQCPPQSVNVDAPMMVLMGMSVGELSKFVTFVDVTLLASQMVRTLPAPTYHKNFEVSGLTKRDNINEGGVGSHA